MIPNSPSPTTMRRYVANVRRTYAEATMEQEAKGKAWYSVAHDLAVMFAESLGDVDNPMADNYAVDRAAGVIAALSANKSWRENVRLAARAVNGDAGGHVRDALTKVERMLDGEHPLDVLPIASKTGQFYLCISDPSDTMAVVVDRHAHDVAVGKVYGNADRGLSSFGRYQSLMQVYRTAAHHLGILPMQVQAVCWVVQTERLAGVGHRGRNLQTV